MRNRFYIRRQCNDTARRRKYGNIPVEYDGQRFDSRKEGIRYIGHKADKALGKIKDFERQVKFELIPKTDRYRPIAYVADFVITLPDGRKVIEDTKSPITRKDRVYRIKKIMMYWKYGIEINEV